MPSLRPQCTYDAVYILINEGTPPPLKKHMLRNKMCPDNWAGMAMASLASPARDRPALSCYRSAMSGLWWMTEGKMCARAGFGPIEADARTFKPWRTLGRKGGREGATCKTPMGSKPIRKRYLRDGGRSRWDSMEATRTDNQRFTSPSAAQHAYTTRQAMKWGGADRPRAP